MLEASETLGGSAYWDGSRSTGCDARGSKLASKRVVILKERSCSLYLDAYVTSLAQTCPCHCGAFR